jgi:outer membrane receptor protein involved in Fe transport
VDYALTEQVMVYATVVKGFQSGGFNTMSTDSEYDSYDSEELWSYEIGAKSQLLDNRLIVTGALFYMDIDDMQVTQESISPPMDLHNQCCYRCLLWGRTGSTGKNHTSIHHNGKRWLYQCRIR